MKEVLVVLKISEQQVNEILSGFTFNKSMKLYGKSATLIFNFYTQSSTYHPLADIIAVFKPEDLESIEKSIKADRGEGRKTLNNKLELQSVVWEDDLIEKNKEWLNTVKTIYKENGLELASDPLVGPVIEGRPLTSWEITLDLVSPSYASVRYSGKLAIFLNYPEKFMLEAINDQAMK